MNLFLRSVVVLAFALALTGCFETKQEFTLNPDGSGKVVQETIFSRPGGMFAGILGQENRSSLEEQMLDAVKDVLTKSKGVDAWRDVTFHRLPDGRISFKGTAYFLDLEDLNIEGLDILSFAWEKRADGGMELRALGTRDQDEKAEPAAPSDLTEQEMTDRVMRAKVSLQESRPLIAGLLGTLKQEAVFHLPGAVTKATVFRKKGEKAVSLTFNGLKVLAALDAMATKDAWWRAQVRAGVDVSHEGFDFDDVEMDAIIFGEAGPVVASIRPGEAPQFDYKAEVAAAKIEYVALTKRLGIKPEETNEEGLTISTGGKSGKAAKDKTQSEGQGELRAARVTGLKAVYEDSGMHMGGAKGVTLGLRGLLPEKAIHPAGGEIKVAMGTDGVSLRLQKSALEEGNFSIDGEMITFDAELALPAASVLSLNEVSGVVDYYVEGPTKKTDFGIGVLKAGATGTESGAVIKTLESPAAGRLGKLQLGLKIGGWRIKRIRVVDAAGREVKVAESSSSWGGDSSDYSYTFETPLPADARIEAEIFDPIEKHQVAFKIEHISLPPHPSAP